MKKVIIVFILLILGIAGFKFFGDKKQPALQFAFVKKQDIRSIVSASGNLTGKSTANLKFKSSGKLAYINVKAGNIISKGKVIAGLDTQDLSITLQQAYNTLRDKQAAKEKAEDDVKGHDSDESFTQKVTRTAAEVAKDNAYDEVKTAQRAFQDSVIVSPIFGLVTQSPAIAGQIVSATDLIAQIVDTSGIYFDTDVDEADIGKISLSLPAEVILDAYPNQVFKGVVDQILPQTKTTTSGATVITVRIKLDNAPKNFVNGLSGEASIIVNMAQNVLTIPVEAIRDDKTVVVQVSNKPETKKVEAGIFSDTDAEIKSGLSEGEKVLLP